MTDMTQLTRIQELISTSDDPRATIRKEVDALELTEVRTVLADHRSDPGDRIQRYLTKCLFGRLCELEVNEKELITEISDWFEKRLPKDEVFNRELLEVINKVAWVTRHETQNIWTAKMREWRNSGGLTTMEFTVDTILLERRRFVFDYKTMGRLIEKTSSHYDNTATAMALRGASIVGGAAPDKNAEIPQEIRDAWKKADDPEATEVRDIVLQALDTSPNGANFAEETLEYIQKYEQDNSVYNYNAPNNILLLSRKARAFQRAGKFEDAMRTISLAIEKNTDQNEYARGMAENLVTQRGGIIESLESAYLYASAKEATDQVKKTENRVHKALNENTLRSTEVLALFSSAVAFAVGSASIGANMTTPSTGLITAGVLLVGLLAFAALLIGFTRLLTGAQETARQRPAWSERSFGLSVAAIVIALVALSLTIFLVFNGIIIEVGSTPNVTS